MSLRNQIIVILCCYFVSFFFIRSFINGINRYLLNNNAYKKKKKTNPFLNGYSIVDLKKKYLKLYKVYILQYYLYTQ